MDGTRCPSTRSTDRRPRVPRGLLLAAGRRHEGQPGQGAAGLFNAPASQMARLAAALQEKKSGEEAA